MARASSASGRRRITGRWWRCRRRGWNQRAPLVRARMWHRARRARERWPRASSWRARTTATAPGRRWRARRASARATARRGGSWRESTSSTSDGLPRRRLAERRLGEVPAVAGGRVGFHPIEGGGAQVDAAVIERSAAPDHVVSWIAAGLHAATDREVTASFASPSGGGELIEASWRWWEHRPRTAVSFSAPAPARLGGVWRVEASRETQTFGTAPARIAETRSGAALTISDWADAGVRWRTGLSMDDWSGRGRAFAVRGGVVWRPFGDLVSIDANAARWIGVTPAFST